jgi:hypothetical protein
MTWRNDVEYLQNGFLDDDRKERGKFICILEEFFNRLSVSYKSYDNN